MDLFAERCRQLRIRRPHGADSSPPAQGCGRWFCAFGHARSSGGRGGGIGPRDTAQTRVM